MKLVAIPRSPDAIDAAWQHAELPAVLTATRAMYQRLGFRLPWIGYIALDQAQIVGTCGFAGPPRHGEVEIAYFCFPEYQGQGVATRMARLLLDTHLAAVEAERCTFIAHTLPAESASTRILSKLGFICLGEVLHPEDGPVWKWRLPVN